MNPNIPESLEDRIAPAAMMDAVPPPAGDDNAVANSFGPVPEELFFGPVPADAVHKTSPAEGFRSGPIAEGRVITDVQWSSISPTFVEGHPGAPLGGLDATLAFRGLMEGDWGNATGVHILSGDPAPPPGASGLAETAALNALTTVAGLTSPVLLVDVPKMDGTL